MEDVEFGTGVTLDFTKGANGLHQELCRLKSLKLDAQRAVIGRVPNEYDAVLRVYLLYRAHLNDFSCLSSVLVRKLGYYIRMNEIAQHLISIENFATYFDRGTYRNCVQLCCRKSKRILKPFVRMQVKYAIMSLHPMLQIQTPKQKEMFCLFKNIETLGWKSTYRGLMLS